MYFYQSIILHKRLYFYLSTEGESSATSGDASVVEGGRERRENAPGTLTLTLGERWVTVTWWRCSHDHMRRISGASTEGLLCVAQGILYKTTAHIVRIGSKNCKRATTNSGTTSVLHFWHTVFRTDCSKSACNPARKENSRSLTLLSGSAAEWVGQPFVMSQREPPTSGGRADTLGDRLLTSMRNAHLFRNRRQRFWLGSTNTWLIVPFFWRSARN